MSDDRSDDELLRSVLPGGTHFKVNVLCPRCGWHFPKGMSDPEGRAVGIVADCVTVCGRCLSILKFDADLQPVLQTPDDINGWPQEDRDKIKQIWFLAFVARALGPDMPEEPMQ